MTQVQIKTGLAGKTKLKLSAKRSGLSLPNPVGGTYLRQDPSVLVQSRSSTGMCWTSEFAVTDTNVNAPDKFNASTK